MKMTQFVSKHTHRQHWAMLYASKMVFFVFPWENAFFVVIIESFCFNSKAHCWVTSVCLHNSMITSNLWVRLQTSSRVERSIRSCLKDSSSTSRKLWKVNKGPRLDVALDGRENATECLLLAFKQTERRDARACDFRAQSAEWIKSGCRAS